MVSLVPTESVSNRLEEEISWLDKLNNICLCQNPAEEYCDINSYCLLRQMCQFSTLKRRVDPIVKFNTEKVADAPPH